MAEMSECRCRLNPGEWGGGTHHYRRITREFFVNREMQRFFGGIRSATGYSSAEEQLARERAEIAAEHYIGEPIAFEPCKEHEERVKREIERLRIERNKQTDRSGTPYRVER